MKLRERLTYAIGGVLELLLIAIPPWTVRIDPAHPRTEWFPMPIIARVLGEQPLDALFPASINVGLWLAEIAAIAVATILIARALR